MDADATASLQHDRNKEFASCFPASHGGVTEVTHDGRQKRTAAAVAAGL
jgi:hypothetical protein